MRVNVYAEEMTDDEWAAAVAITGGTPYTDEQIREMAEQS